MTDAPSLLPPASTPLERAIEQATARVCDVPTPQRGLMSPAACPIGALPWLGWALSIDRWDADWSEADKRAAVARAIADQRIKGTRQAVENVLATFADGGLQLVEWWEMTPKGTPHTFDVRLSIDDTTTLTDVATLDALIREIVKVKPVRSHFTFVQQLAGGGAIAVIAAAQAAGAVRLDMTADVGN